MNLGIWYKIRFWEGPAHMVQPHATPLGDLCKWYSSATQTWWTFSGNGIYNASHQTHGTLCIWYDSVL